MRSAIAGSASITAVQARVATPRQNVGSAATPPAQADAPAKEEEPAAWWEFWKWFD